MLGVVLTLPKHALLSLRLCPKGEIREWCKEGKQGAAVSDADFLMGKVCMGAIKPRRIRRGHLKVTGSRFTAFTEHLKSVTWCDKSTRVTGLCV